jgi:hypothetical protein
VGTALGALGVADGAGSDPVGTATGVASSSLPASGSPAGSPAPVGSGTGVAVGADVGVRGPLRDGIGTGEAVLVRDGIGTGDGAAVLVRDGTGDGAAVGAAGAGDPPWACPVAAIAAVPPPSRASPVTAAITQARLTRGRLLLDSMCVSRMRMRLWFVGGKYGRPAVKLCARGRNLRGRPAVYARAGEATREGYVG